MARTKGEEAFIRTGKKGPAPARDKWGGGATFFASKSFHVSKLKGSKPEKGKFEGRPSGQRKAF